MIVSACKQKMLVCDGNEHLLRRVTLDRWEHNFQNAAYTAHTRTRTHTRIRARTHTVAAALKHSELNPNTDTLRDSGCWINDADCFPHGWGLAADSLRGQSRTQFSNVRKKKKITSSLCLSVSLPHTDTPVSSNSKASMCFPQLLPPMSNAAKAFSAIGGAEEQRPQVDRL